MSGSRQELERRGIQIHKKVYEEKKADDIGIGFEDHEEKRIKHYPIYVKLVKESDENDKKKHLVPIFETHQMHDPAHYVLLLPNGTSGWNKSNEYLSSRMKKISVQEFYKYQIQQRQGAPNCLLRSRRLLMEYICTQCFKMENERLSYYSRPAFQQQLHRVKLNDSEKAINSGKDIKKKLET